MFKKVFIPYKGYWSSPFSRWQGTLQNQHPLTLGAATAKKFLELRGYDPKMLDGCVYGQTIGMPAWFYANPWFSALMGNDKISGPTVSQACATGATCVYKAAADVEVEAYSNVMVATTDRCSNGPHTIWPNPNGPGGEVISENWLMDNFNKDPYGGEAMFMTAEHVAKDAGGVAKEESDAWALKLYEKYMMSQENDREFQKGYMIPLDVKISKKKSIVFEEDEGIMPMTAEGLAKLKPIIPDGALTFGAQTHPADGNAGMIVTTQEKAKELSADKNVTIQVLSYGYARAEKARMAAAVSPAAQMALDKAGIGVGDLAAVKTHNPFSVNDIVMCRIMKIPENILNNYGSSMIFGHPQGPTGTRCIVELIEELVKIGGGYGLFAGCAAGDTAAAIVLKVN
jgi:acetyl-CoA acetyltransferase